MLLLPVLLVRFALEPESSVLGLSTVYLLMVGFYFYFCREATGINYAHANSRKLSLAPNHHLRNDISLFSRNLALTTILGYQSGHRVGGCEKN